MTTSMTPLVGRLDGEDLIATQVRLEEEMTQRGVSRFQRNVEAARRMGAEDGTESGSIIVSGRMKALAEAIKAWMDESEAGVSSRWGSAYKLLRGYDADVLAYLTLKHTLAGISQPRTLQHVSVSIAQSVEDEMRLSGIRDKERKKYDQLVERANKRSSQRHKHIYATRVASALDTWSNWSNNDRIHVGTKLLELLMNSVGLIHIATNGEGTEKALKYVKPLESTLEWIARKNNVTAMLRPVYEPMVVPPRNWTSPTDGGYLSSSLKPLRMVKTRNRAYLEELGNVDMPMVYTALNAIQATAWQINTPILNIMTTLWEQGATWCGLPPREGIPQPVKPFDIDTNEVARAAWRKAAFKAHSDNLEIQGARINVSMSLDIANRYSPFRKIYFPYQLDFRGRIYAVPHLNPQGADHTKGLLRFAYGKPLGEHGAKWLAIHGANVAGYDKASLEDRVKWVHDHQAEILAIAADPFQARGWADHVGAQAIDKPWQFLAFCLEWKGYCEHGDRFVSKLPIAMDGSCSGIQHFSAMLRDEVGGAAVNLVPSDLPADVYGLVAKKVIERAIHDAKHGTEDVLKHDADGKAYVQEGTKNLAQQWTRFGINRKVTKRSVMTLAYGSKEYGFKDQVMEDILDPARKKATDAEGNVDARHFPFTGDGFRAAGWMAKAIWEAVNQVLVKAGEAMKWLQDAATLAAKEELPVCWTTAVGFPVMQAYNSVVARRVKTAINGARVRLLMNEEQDALDKRKQSQGISPNFVHSCDAAHLMLTVVRGVESGLKSFAMIHDSFGTTAGETELFFMTVRKAFIEMYEETAVLERFRDELAAQLSDKARAKLAELPKRGSLSLAAVAESRFCFA